MLVRAPHFSLIPAVALTLVVAIIVGCSIDWLAYSPLYRKRASTSIYLLNSFGLYTALINLVALVYRSEVRILPTTPQSTLFFGPVLLTENQLIQITISIILLPMMFALRKSICGRLIRAVRDDAALAETTGVNLFIVRSLVFATGSAFAAVAAILAVLDVGADPQAGLPVLLTAAVAVIVGGIGSFGGPILGSVFIGALQSLAVWVLSPRWAQTITFSVLILFMIFRPIGILNATKRLEEAFD